MLLNFSSFSKRIKYIPSNSNSVWSQIETVNAHAQIKWKEKSTNQHLQKSINRNRSRQQEQTKHDFFPYHFGSQTCMQTLDTFSAGFSQPPRIRKLFTKEKVKQIASSFHNLFCFVWCCCAEPLPAIIIDFYGMSEQIQSHMRREK